MGSLEELARYLAVKVLVGKHYVVDAVYAYFVLNMSPRQIADMYGLTVNQVRGYIQRVTEKTFSFSRARVLLKHLYPFIVTLEPLIENMECRVCGAPLHFGVAEEHVKMLHMDIVDTCVEKIVESLLYSAPHMGTAKAEVVA